MSRISGWTNKEIQTLRRAYSQGSPSGSELKELLPRHTVASCRRKAWQLEITFGVRGDQIRRMKFAHEYFARRESGMLA